MERSLEGAVKNRFSEDPGVAFAKSEMGQFGRNMEKLMGWKIRKNAEEEGQIDRFP